MSSVLQAEDAVRLPSCVNNLGEYLTTSSDSIREAGGNAIAAYSFSSLEQYIPFYLMQSARIMASGSMGKLITMNGIESLDRTGSVLYRDLKGATSFENSFWDEDAAAHSFEQSAIFISLMEISQKDVSDVMDRYIEVLLFVCCQRTNDISLISMLRFPIRSWKTTTEATRISSLTTTTNSCLALMGLEDAEISVVSTC
jgi:hypothetical protein